MTSIASKILSFWLLGCFALENSFANGECKFCEGDFNEAKALPSSITSAEGFPDTVKTCGGLSDIVVDVVETAECDEVKLYAGYCECTTTPTSCNFCEGDFTKDKALPSSITNGEDFPELTKTCGQLSDFIKPFTDSTACNETKVLGGYCECTTTPVTCKFCDGDFTKDKALPATMTNGEDFPELVKTCGQYSDFIKYITNSTDCGAAKMAASFCDCTTASPTVAPTAATTSPTVAPTAATTSPTVAPTAATTSPPVAPTAATTSESPSSSGFRTFYGLYPQMLVLLTALYTN